MYMAKMPVNPHRSPKYCVFVVHRMAETGSMSDRGEPCSIDMYNVNDDYPITTTEAVPDTLPPDERSHVAPSSSTNVLSVPLAFIDAAGNVVQYPNYSRDERNYVPTMNQSIKVYHNMNSNTLCLFIAGGNNIKTNEYKTFEYDCHKSMLNMRKVIQEQNKIPNENIVFISPNYLKFRDTCKRQPITENVTKIFNDIIQIHKSKPFNGFFLYIVGHAESYNGFYLRQHCKISLNYLTNSVIPCFGDCKLLVIFKDMCHAEKFDLLSAVSNDRPEGSLHVQYSSSQYDGKSYGYISGARLFSYCIITGFEAQVCPIENYPSSTSYSANIACIPGLILAEYWA